MLKLPSDGERLARLAQPVRTLGPLAPCERDAGLVADVVDVEVFRGLPGLARSQGIGPSLKSTTEVIKAHSAEVKLFNNPKDDRNLSRMPDILHHNREYRSSMDW